MAEPRRVQLSSIPSNAPVQPPSPKKPRNDDQDPEMSMSATVRIALTLFQPDQKKCPEFCYPELLRNLQGNHKKQVEKTQKKPLDPFNIEEAERKEVEALSKKFEEKYGKQKRRRDRVQDLIDIGYGYDESDSFIDNSEAYDELVPASLNTKYGGFYINSGTLQFRQASESEDESVREKKKKSTKKMKERGDKVKKRKREDEKKGKKKFSKVGFTALNGTKDKKKKTLLLGNLQEMMAKIERDTKKFENFTTAATTAAPKTSLSSATAPTLPPPPPREAEPAPDPGLSSIASESERLQAANAGDSLTKKEPENLPDVTPDKGSGSAAGEAPKEEFKKPPSNPEGLPPAIEKKMKELTKAVLTSDGDKKTILFTPEMNAALLEIYLLSRDLSSGLRSSVFSHLSSVLPCSKDTLVKWCSRLYLHKQGGRFREPLRKLREAVAKAMPEQIFKYHAELKVHNQAKYAKMMSEEKEQKMPPEEEEEEDKAGKKAAAGPRKKFQWTEEIRQLLGQLVRTKVNVYESEGSGMSSLEDYLKYFLDEEVKPLWPRGWMQARTLCKESRRLYPQLSSLIAKNKTVTPPKTKVKESSNKPDKNIPGSSMETQGGVTAPAKDMAGQNLTMTLNQTPTSASRNPTTSASTSGPAHTQDNSLDGDLILNPPSLDGVSEHLTLPGRTSGLVFEFPAPSKSSGPEKPSVAVLEEKRPCPLPSAATIVAAPQPASRPVFHKKFIVPGPEKKMPPPVPSPKPSPVTQQKQRQPTPHPPGPARTPATNPSLQPAVNIYQISNQVNKGSFTPPIQSGGAKVPAPSQQLLTPQTKPLRPQGIPPPPPSSSGSSHRPLVSTGFIVRHPNNAGTVRSQIYRTTVNRLPGPPHGNLSGHNPIMSLNQPPSSASRNPTAMSVKKPPHPPQKLTLMAPQDSGRGTQGVAKLLTSSMVAGVGGNATSNINAQKGGRAPGLLGSAPLTILTSSYKQNGGKMSAPASLSLLSPINSFPLHVVSFTTEPPPKAGASMDAVVTGPAPGTFNHGLPRNILGGLHSSTAHHSTLIPRPALSGHLQPAQTDGAHTHGKGTVPSQMRSSHPNNP
ncbi:ubinuclein-1 isoform X2 [Rhinoderma darwinii]|uniref:ubinuclein-1 isoform X2 n=1 Tax=Rhinoderma darwinii TaxID=43563 RepID=UPI003F663E57